MFALLLLSFKCFASPARTRRQGCSMLSRGCKVLSQAYSWILWGLQVHSGKHDSQFAVLRFSLLHLFFAPKIGCPGVGEEWS